MDSGLIFLECDFLGVVKASGLGLLLPSSAKCVIRSDFLHIDRDLLLKTFGKVPRLVAFLSM